jgi:hypothetical protein
VALSTNDETDSKEILLRLCSVSNARSDMIYYFGNLPLRQLLKWSSVEMVTMAMMVEKGEKLLRVGMIC